jgi:hypothetical protein
VDSPLGHGDTEEDTEGREKNIFTAETPRKMGRDLETD